MKAYLIDPFAKTVTEVTCDYETNSIQAIYDLIDCHCFDCVVLNNERDTVYVDDNGLFAEPKALFQLEGYPQPLANKGLVLGTNDEGETQEPTMSLETLREGVTFPGCGIIPAATISSLDDNNNVVETQVIRPAFVVEDTPTE